MSSARTIGRRIRDYVRLISERDPTLALATIPRKLNFGCGYDKRPGYLNIDVDPACQPDVLIQRGDFSRIPRHHFEEVFANDVLEHVPRAQTLSVLLDFSDYLVDGGKLILQTSSILGVAAKLQQLGRYADHHGWTICLFGNQAHPGDFHHTGFTEVTLRVHLRAAGFSVDALHLKDDWLFYVEATKVESWTAAADDQTLQDRDFLDAVYRDALFRQPDEKELAHWIKALRTGTTRKHIAKELFSAPDRSFKVAARDGL